MNWKQPLLQNIPDVQDPEGGLSVVQTEAVCSVDNSESQTLVRDYQESLLRLMAKASENPLPHENIPESSNEEIKENILTESQRIDKKFLREYVDTKPENVESSSI